MKLTCNCNYYIHLQCLLKWVDIKPICPTCRAPIKVKNKKRPQRNQNRNGHRTRRSIRRSRRVADEIYNTRNYNRSIVYNRNTNNNVSQLQARIFLSIISIVGVILIIIYL